MRQLLPQAAPDAAIAGGKHRIDRTGLHLRDRIGLGQVHGLRPGRGEHGRRGRVVGADPEALQSAVSVRAWRDQIPDGAQGVT